MATELAQIMDDFYDYFLGLYHETRRADATTGHAADGAAQPTASAPEASAPEASAPEASAPASGLPFIAFEGIGTALTPSMFKLESGEFYPPLVAEQFSLLANVVPVLNGCVIAAPGLLTVDGYYGALLEQAQPLPDTGVDAFNALKTDAEKVFENASVEPRVSGHVPYRPALPIPPDWPLPSGAEAWVPHSLSRAETSTQTQSTATGIGIQAPPPAPARVMPAWGWRIAPPALAAAVTSLGAAHDAVPRRTLVPVPAQPAAAHPPPLHLAASQLIQRRATFMAGAVAAAAHPAPPAAVHAPAPPHIAPPAIVHAAPPPATAVRPDTLALHVQELSQRASQRSVTSQGLTLAFEYCLVTASRPWLSAVLLATRSWFVPGMRAGEIASGTGSGSGVLESIPVAAIVVRKLNITAQWSQGDAAVLGSSVNLGPFSLVGRTITQGTQTTGTTLSCEGMQIVAWVLQPLPTLPPASDPALTAATAPAASSTPAPAPAAIAVPAPAGSPAAAAPAPAVASATAPA